MLSVKTLAATVAVMMSLGLAACAADDAEPPPSPVSDTHEVSSEQTEGASNGAVPSGAPMDVDPDADASPLAEAKDDDANTAPATQDELIKTFAPHLHLHPEDTYRPANVDWYLARVTMRYNHDNCPDHEIFPVGKLTQANLVTQTHEDNGSFCQHDSGKKVTSTASEGFFLEIGSEATRKGAARAEWKTYAVWRPTSGGLVNIEYWFFYPYNDGFSIFNHESDWEHATVTIDPKANNGQGKATQVMLSAHKGGTTLKVGDPKLKMDGTHPISYVARGTHANYPSPGTFEIPGTQGVAKDNAKAVVASEVWKTESVVVNIGTRAKPKNGQVFVKFWGRWGEVNDVPETNGITRHFP